MTKQFDYLTPEENELVAAQRKYEDSLQKEFWRLQDKKSKLVAKHIDPVDAEIDENRRVFKEQMKVVRGNPKFYAAEMGFESMEEFNRVMNQRMI